MFLEGESQNVCLIAINKFRGQHRTEEIVKMSNEQRFEIIEKPTTKDQPPVRESEFSEQEQKDLIARAICDNPSPTRNKEHTEKEDWGQDLLTDPFVKDSEGSNFDLLRQAAPYAKQLNPMQQKEAVDLGAVVQQLLVDDQKQTSRNPQNKLLGNCDLADLFEAPPELEPLEINGYLMVDAPPDDNVYVSN